MHSANPLPWVYTIIQRSCRKCDQLTVHLLFKRSIQETALVAFPLCFMLDSHFINDYCPNILLQIFDIEYHVHYRAIPVADNYEQKWVIRTCKGSAEVAISHRKPLYNVSLASISKNVINAIWVKPSHVKSIWKQYISAYNFRSNATFSGHVQYYSHKMLIYHSKVPISLLQSWKTISLMNNLFSLWI